MKHCILFKMVLNRLHYSYMKAGQRHLYYVQYLKADSSTEHDEENNQSCDDYISKINNKAA